jgi:ubiquinone biosynthesis protein
MYAKILPMLPRLMHDYLQRPAQDDRQLLVQLIQEQRKVRQNQRALGWALLGFVAGTLVALLAVFH